MNTSATYVTQSKFFSPAFNAAIFDGPIRIYFAQYQEAQALKLYFNLQERFAHVRKATRDVLKDRANIFVMLYPTEETFEMSFGDSAPEMTGSGAEASKGWVARGRLGDDYVLGVRGLLEDETLANICGVMDQIVSSVPGLSTRASSEVSIS
jgi:hypothetical protein